ncbi:hypothetical protein FRC12_014638 [Ceratobasidium sp. 428]|nr:hypothetical protein FRC12_014638 [Ceratobasidium sp. 428]
MTNNRQLMTQLIQKELEVGSGLASGPPMNSLQSRNIKATPDQPPRPPPETYPPSTIPPPPTSSVQNLPTQVPLPPLPPYNHFPTTPNSPYVLPDVGRIDLCRPWAYSLDTGARPTYSDGKPVDRLLYTVPSIAPIHIEASAVCPTSEGLNRYCTEYDDSKDAVSGKLNVVGGDVELPTVELFVQHGSELGLEGLSICLVQQSLSEGEVIGGKDYKWVLGINIWKDPTSDTPNNFLASVSIIITLPYSKPHNLMTRINYFTQTIGRKESEKSSLLSFETLRLRTNNGNIQISNVQASTIDGYSEYDWVSVGDSRITKSLDLRSKYGIVSCNATLAQTGSGHPVRVNLESTARQVKSTKYPLGSTEAPRFEVSAFSQFSRAMIWMTDHLGTEFLRTNKHPSVLPSIFMNLTSQFAAAQVLLPATYHGSIDFGSESAAIRIIDEACQLPGRTVQWLEQSTNALRGNIRWTSGAKGEAGSVRASTEFAVVRALFLGLNDEWRVKWPVPKEGQNQMSGREGLMLPPVI